MKTLFTAATLIAAFAIVGCNNNKSTDAAPGATSGCCGSCGGDAAPGAVSGDCASSCASSCSDKMEAAPRRLGDCLQVPPPARTRR